MLGGAKILNMIQIAQLLKIHWAKGGRSNSAETDHGQ